MSNPFDFINAVSFTKQDVIRQASNPDQEAKGYVPWVTNKTLSYFEDSIIHANMMNKYAFLTNQQQFDFFLNSINKRKRFAKQAKKIASDDVQAIADYFGYSLRRAEESMKFLTQQQIDEIKKKTDVGGVR